MTRPLTFATSPFVSRTLDNGLQIWLERLPHVPSAASGFLVRTGARDETAANAGVSHFLEHMCFKGTAARSWMEINQGFDRLGSTYNAFTGEEHTMYYGWLPAESLAAQNEILADMMQSVFPPEEFVTEKQVILEEIAMYRDNLARSMFDLATREIFRGSPLGHSILGTAETIGPLTRDQMLDYHRQCYAPDNMVFVATGNIDPPAIIAQLETLTATWQPCHRLRNQPPPPLRTGVAKERLERFKQQALMLCFPAPAGKSDDPRVHVLCNILSGDNSRIYWEVIQRGLCPQAGAFYLDYSDTGVLVLFALCEPERVSSVHDALLAQAREITETGPTDFEVQRVKNGARTSLANAGDSPMSRLLQVAEDVDLLGEPLTLENRLSQLDAVTVQDVRDLLAAYPITGDHMLVSVGPLDWP